MMQNQFHMLQVNNNFSYFNNDAHNNVIQNANKLAWSQHSQCLVIGAVDSDIVMCTENDKFTTPTCESSFSRGCYCYAMQRYEC